MRANVSPLSLSVVSYYNFFWCLLARSSISRYINSLCSL